MFDNLFKAIVGVVVLPVDVVKDVATLGGSVIDEDTPATIKRLRQINSNIDKAVDPDGD